MIRNCPICGKDFSSPFSNTKTCSIKCHKKRINILRRPFAIKWAKEHPWYSSFYEAKRRCSNPTASGYRWYGGKGIKFLMSLDDFEFMWKRDKADLMERPSVDRIDGNKDYTLENCRYMELLDNCRRKKTMMKNFKAKQALLSGKEGEGND